MHTRQPSSPSSKDETWLDAESIHSTHGQPVPVALEDALIGTTLLDTYTVDRVMGEGGMGRIYEAHHVRVSGKRFAIKVLRPELVSNAHIRARFEREMVAIARVTHPGVVAISDVGKTALGLPFMVCEHLGGLDLLAYVRRFGALSDERVVYMGCRVAEALEVAHAQGVIHRDIKPSNVFLLGAFAPLGPEWDRVKIIDFGLSRLAGQDDQLTETGVVLGTPSYMAPEQARGMPTDHRTDIYGVGAVLYAAATGVPPFRESTPQQTLIAVMSRDPVRPREINPKISERLELVIQRAMSKLPEQRHPSISALRLALSELEAAAPLGSYSRIRAHGGGIRGVRMRFVALSALSVLLAAVALVSVLAGLTPLGQGGLQLTATEGLALVTLLAIAGGMLLRSLRRFRQGTWRNTAELSDRLPRLRAPVLGALVVYALASLAVRFAQDVLPRFLHGGELAAFAGDAGPDWSAALSLGALLAALGIAIEQSWWQPMRPRERWVWGAVMSAAAVLAFLGFSRWTVLERGVEHMVLAPASVAARSGWSRVSGGSAAELPSVGTGLSSSGAPAASDAGSAGDGGTLGAAEASTAHEPAVTGGALRLVPAPLESAAPSAASPSLASPSLASPSLASPSLISPNDGASSAAASNATAASAGRQSPAPPIASPAAAPPGAAPLARSAEAPALAAGPSAAGAPLGARSSGGASAGSSAPASAAPPARDVTVDVARLTEEERAAPAPDGDSPEGLKARSLEQSRRTEMLGAVQTIERLLAVSPAAANDPDVRRVLGRAAGAGPDASRAAFRVMTSSMGSAGPDLLYQLMLNRPSLADQAKFLLSRNRVRKLFTPELAIAYDLRFSPSCTARLGLLDRASEIGDQRTINTLAALLSNAPECGQPGHSPCLELCEHESAQFNRAVDAIVRRLRGNERAASMN
jgi:tRNA A-37 threonylcarbamoyl transferase component Bud32